MSDVTDRIEALEALMQEMSRRTAETYPARMKDGQLRDQIDRAARRTVKGHVAEDFGAVAAALPPGVVADYAGSAAPSGWLMCDGSAVSRTTYANLFSVVGTTYGVGDGTTTFNVPDGRARVAVQYKSGDADFGTLGGTAGAKTVAAAGTNSAPTFSGSALATHTHTVVSNVTGTLTPSGVIAWPAGVPTQAADTFATDQFTKLASTGPAIVSETSTGAISWPAGVPTFTGTTNQSVTMTNNSVTSGATSAGTPAGTVSAPAFTGSATSVLQPSITLNRIIKT